MPSENAEILEFADALRMLADRAHEAAEGARAMVLAMPGADPR
jgi:hypothetical protein